MLCGDLASEGGHAESLRGVRIAEPPISCFNLFTVVFDMVVNLQGLFVHFISFLSHDGTPLGQMFLALSYSHFFNLVHLASQTVGVFCFLDLELGLSDDRWLL